MSSMQNIRFDGIIKAFLVMLLCLFVSGQAEAVTLNVLGCDADNNCTTPVNGFRWLLEEDNTNQAPPGVRVSDSAGLDIYSSHAPTISTGSSITDSATVAVPSKKKLYYVSVLPNSGYAASGAQVMPGQKTVTVKVHLQPLPTAQLSVLVFKDHSPINNIFDTGEAPLAGWTVLLFDQLGEVTQDACGNPLGTTYDGSTCLDVDVVGNGLVQTDAEGRVFIKFLPPGKYGVRTFPPAHEATQWVQTATIEGTPGIDAWIKANEPATFIEGFGTGFFHAFIGMVRPLELPWGAGGPGGSTITGVNRFNHFGPPPNNQGFFAGDLVGECWAGLNDPVTKQGLAAVPCDAASRFTFNGVPDGTYQLVTWDRPLDALFGIHTLNVAGANIDLGNVLSFRWFGTLQGTIFYDSNQNGFMDPGETGIMDQAVNLRFRDGSIYQATVSDPTGEYELPEVFPFFKWLVAEVDFLRFKATGVTNVVDAGGIVLPHNGWTYPSFDKLNPQPQKTINPNTSNNLSRTETGPILTQATMTFLNQTNVIDWGKVDYVQGENGGISGIVYYATTRAEDDPAVAAADPWEPGIPDVKVNLYRDFNADGIPDGPAIATARTDSWDLNKPSGCIQPPLLIPNVKECFDNYATWNQIRPGIFDGGYAFGPNIRPGTYIVEVVPPANFIVQREEDKNVDFGEGFYPSPLLTPPPCVGPLHDVPQYLALFPDQLIEVTGWTPGMQRPLCTMKQVLVEEASNTAADFFLFTEVPKAARNIGFVNNDLSAEFRAASPVFGEKSSPSWLPVSYRDWRGNEVYHAYSDEFGTYTALLPSTFTVSAPIPTGVAPNMVTVYLNYPLCSPVHPENCLNPLCSVDSPDECAKGIDKHYKADYGVTPWTFDFWPGKTTPTDTPILPIAAFAGFPQNGPDVEPQDGTPVITSVLNSTDATAGPVVCALADGLTITAAGQTQVLNPDFNPGIPASPETLTRDYGFGTTRGLVTVNGIALADADILTWTDTSITISTLNVLAGGQLMVMRGDNAKTSLTGITVHADAGCTNVLRVPSVYATIQAAIDAANADDAADLTTDIIVVAPGTYRENIFLYGDVILQGSGLGVTNLFATAFGEQLTAWHQKASDLQNITPDLFVANEAPGIMVLGTGIVNPLVDPTHDPKRIDGLKIFGSISGGGIYVNTDVGAVGAGIQITNNRINGNQGTLGGGITFGIPDTGAPNNNPSAVVMFNQIVKNGGVQGGGGIVLYEGTTGYLIEKNVIAGNFGRFNGGGISHVGVSDGGMIRDNSIIFNETAFGFVAFGDGAGIFIGSQLANGPLPADLGLGTGNVTIDANLIQGNLAGTGSGGGIAVAYADGQDEETGLHLPVQVTISNNIIVNNAAGYRGGGIWLQDADDVLIYNNTIANNDSTATAASAFPAGQLVGTPGSQTIPQGAGIVANPHSGSLQAATGNTFSDPVIQNNIVYGNRSFFTGYDTQGLFQGLIENATDLIWDLQVADIAGAQFTQVTTSMLTDTTPAHGGDYTLGGNIVPSIPDLGPRFVRPYLNELQTAAVIDEGGNFITVRYTPLTPDAGDYHLRPNSDAVDHGADTATAVDYDGDARTAGLYDIGADEVVPALFTTLTLLTPAEGETVATGSLYGIYWGAPIDPAYNNYRLQLSLDNGATWTLIQPDITATSFDWTVPAPAKNKKKARIRLAAFNENGVKQAQVVSAPFAIDGLELTYPNGGEVLTSGSTYTIRWDINATKSDVGRVILEFTRDGGLTWELIDRIKVTDPNAVPVSYDWTVPNISNTKMQAKVRVTLKKAGKVIGKDASDDFLYLQPNHLIPR